VPGAHFIFKIRTGLLTTNYFQLSTIYYHCFNSRRPDGVGFGRCPYFCVALFLYIFSEILKSRLFSCSGKGRKEINKATYLDKNFFVICTRASHEHGKRIE